MKKQQKNFITEELLQADSVMWIAFDFDGTTGTQLQISSAVKKYTSAATPADLIHLVPQYTQLRLQMFLRSMLLNEENKKYVKNFQIEKIKDHSIWFDIEISRKGSHFLLICFDVTEKIIAVRHHRALFNSNIVAINHWDTEGRIWGVNEAYTEMKGYTEHDLRDIKWTDLVPPEDLELIHKPGVEKNRQGIPIKPVESRMRHKNGHYINILTGYAMPEGSQTTGICMTLDITPLKKAEEALQTALGKRDEFVSIASHELKTPLTTLKVSLQLIQSLIEEKDYESASDYLRKCERNINGQIRLVNELLDITKIDSGKIDLHLEMFSGHHLIELAIEFFNSAGKASTVNFEGDFNVLFEADRSRIEQVFINLLSNALKYSNEVAKININFSKKETKVVITVSDNGIGISDEHLPFVFDRFYRVNHAYKKAGGLGLGLYISREIIRMHNGDLKVVSTPGKGAAFIIELPIKNQEPK